jgi:hypothetical protein
MLLTAVGLGSPPDADEVTAEGLPDWFLWPSWDG